MSPPERRSGAHASVRMMTHRPDRHDVYATDPGNLS
jgi:hypothetical protein